MRRICLSRRKGVSAMQLSIQLDTQYDTAHYLSTCLRVACGASMFNITLEGVVESDEVFVGGSDSCRHLSKKPDFSSQAPVLTLIQAASAASPPCGCSLWATNPRGPLSGCWFAISMPRRPQCR